MSILFFSIALELGSITATTVGSEVSMRAAAAGIETLPDGNFRDPAPSAAELAQLVAQSTRNLVSMPAGIFEMGDWGPEVNEGGLPFDGPDSKPLHKVELDAFSISKYPVTYAEFDIFTAALRLPRINQSGYNLKYRKPNNPVDVTWDGAHDYCRWLAKLSGHPFDLPTEAQWEYAARSGGKRLRYPTDNGKYEPGRNLPSFEQKEAAGGVVPAGSFPPNPAGIFHMSGGILEWVLDWYDPNYYDRSPAKNPQGPSAGEDHVARGFFGDGGSEMSFKRWSLKSAPMTNTWTEYDAKTGHVLREIPYTKYSQLADSGFRCVVNR